MIKKVATNLDNLSWVYEYLDFKQDGEIGDPILCSPFDSISAQAVGDLSHDSVIRFDVSNDGTNWVDAVDQNDNNIELEDGQVVILSSKFLYIRPYLLGVSNLGVKLIILGKGKK